MNTLARRLEGTGLFSERTFEDRGQAHDPREVINYADCGRA